MDSTLSRRNFVKFSAATSGGLLVSINAKGAETTTTTTGKSSTTDPAAFVPNAFLKILPDNTIEFTLDRVEMGQGVFTSHTQIIAEELDVDPNKIKVRFSPADRAYANADLGFQLTGGSASVKASWQPLREAGALARMLLVAAAAKNWGVKETECKAQLGEISHTATGRKVTYGDMAVLASQLDPPQQVPLKEKKDFKFIGQSLKRLDAPAKVDGSAIFGIDVSLPDMLHAVIIRPGELKAKLKAFDAAEAKKITGVHLVTAVSQGVAIIAEHYWQARQAAALVNVEWTAGELASISSDALWETYKELSVKKGKSARQEGDFDDGIKNATTTIDAQYYVPFMAHATMEPQNCTAHVTADTCEIWVPTQNLTIAQEVAAAITGLPTDKVNVHQTFVGGGFGRRIVQDFVAEAVEVAKLVKQPVKLIWSREDDMQNDYYRPAAYHVLKGGVTATGKVAAWRHRIVGQGILSQAGEDFIVGAAPAWLAYGLRRFIGRTAAGLYKNMIVDTVAVEGASDFDYQLEHIDVDYVYHEPGIPVGFWRSVGHSGNAFVVESFIDELAHAAKEDPYKFRQRHLQGQTRNLGVLDLVAEKSGWLLPPPPGIFRGIAQHHCFNSFAAEVAEVSVENGQIKVHRIVCAIDCGLVINPDLVAAQVESSIVYGLSAALKGQITFSNGQVQQSNFHEFEVLRMHEMPRVEVHIAGGEHEPTGVGEPGLPPVAPAVANAVFAATGKRLRAMPFKV